MMYPTREGITIRIGEILVALRALHKAAAMLSLNVEGVCDGPHYPDQPIDRSGYPAPMGGRHG